MQRRSAITALAITVILGAFLAPADAAPAAPAVQPDKSATLSPRLALLAQPSLALSSIEARAARLALPASGPGSLITSPSGQVLVYVRAATTVAAVASAVRSAGGTVVHQSERYATVTASMPPLATPVLAASPAVLHVSEALAPLGGGTRSLARGLTNSLTRTVVPTCGIVTSEGDDQLDAKAARDRYGIDGTGVTVGVISDSYDRATFVRRATTDVSSGDLPGPSNPCSRTTPVTVVDDGASGTDLSDEGRGMLQLVHDLAPGANLQFATGWRGLYEFADAVRNLRTSGSTVIVDDLAYLDEPTFQQGPISQAIADVTIAGTHYLTAVGNDNLIVSGRDVASWEAPSFRGTPCPGAASVTCLDFDPGANANAERQVTLAPGGSILLGLHWAQPWNGVTVDLDLFVFDHNTGSTLTSSTDNNSASGRPFELVSYTNRSSSSRVVDIVVPRYAGTARPRVKLVFVGSHGVTKVQYPVSANGDIVGPTVYGHAGSPNATSVGAVAYDESVPERFSSRGPMTTYFGPVVGSTAAAPTSPRVISKPDLSATDGGGTTFFGENVAGVSRFYGTSAAAPHAAAIVALIMDYRSRNSLAALNPSGMRTLITGRATPMPGVALTTGGSGLISALGALAVTPAQPGAATAVAGSARASISWAPTADTGGAPLRRYSVTSSPAGARCTSAALPATTAVCTNLINGTSYRFTVRAVNAAGSSVGSVTNAVTPLGVPTAPQRLAVSFPSAGRATITWRGPANTGGRPLLRYEYCVARCATTSNWRSTSPVLNARAALNDRVRGRSYTVSVRAVNSLGRGGIATISFVQQR